MDTNVQWVEGRPASEDEIAFTSRSLGVDFPSDYLTVMRKAEEGRPIPNRYKGKVFGYLLNMSASDTDGIIRTMQAIKDRLAQGVVPFAADPGGNYWCFDYRNKARSAPTIVYVSLDQSPSFPLEHYILLAEDSFARFVDALS